MGGVRGAGEQGRACDFQSSLRKFERKQTCCISGSPEILVSGGIRYS